MSYFVYPSGINGTSVAKFMKIYYQINLTKAN